MHERSLWRHSCFATLTYEDAAIPPDFGLDLAEFTKFWKRLRKAVLPRRLRYYGCGEYGEQYGRPHYHAIVFGVSPSEKDLVRLAWGHGNVYLGTVTMQSARYVADYVGKAVTGERGKALYGGRRAPFAVMSQGIGRGFVDGNRDQLLRLGVVTVGGRPMGMPRYYRARLEREFQVLPDLWVSEGKPSGDVLGPDEWDRWFSGVMDRDQREINLRARSGLGRKGSM